MSNGRLQQVVKQFRQQLQHHEATAEKALNDAYVGVLQTVQPRLDSLYREINAKVQAGEDIPLSWLYEGNRLEVLKDLIHNQVNRYAVLAQHMTERQQQIGVSLGTASAQAQLKATVPHGFHWSFGLPSPDAIAHLVGATLKGSPLADLFHGFGFEAAKAVGAVLIRGITLGHGPRVVARDVQQALDVPRQRALTISRTEMLRSYRGAAQENYKANDDVVDKWIWQSALSNNTCAACIAMHGTEHLLSETMESHVCCRCTQIPKTKDWSEILGNLGIDTSSIPDSRPTIPSGVDWFDNQDEATQQAILGKSKYDAWSNGDFTLDELVGKNHSTDWGTSIYVKPLKELVK